MNTRFCLLCATEFVPSVPHQRYCCGAHRLAAWKRSDKRRKRVSIEYQPRPKKEGKKETQG